MIVQSARVVRLFDEADQHQPRQEPEDSQLLILKDLWFNGAFLATDTLVNLSLSGRLF